MFERYLPLQPLSLPGELGPLVPRPPTSFPLPAECSISALRGGLYPIPFRPHASEAEANAPSTIVEALTGSRPAKRLRRRSVQGDPRDSFVVRSLRGSDVVSVKILHDTNLPATYPSSFYTHLLTSSTSLCLIATTSVRPDQIVGAACVRLSPASFDSMTTMPLVYLLSLTIAPSARRSGLASDLVNSAIRALLDSTLPSNEAPTGPRPVQLSLHVSATNLEAQAFYEHLDLQEVARTRGYYRRLRDGSDGEAIEMRGIVHV